MTAPELLAGGIYGACFAFLLVLLFFSWFAGLSRAAVFVAILMLLLTAPIFIVLFLLAAMGGTTVTHLIPGLQGQLEVSTLVFGQPIISELNIGFFIGILPGLLLFWFGLLKPLGIIGHPVKGDPGLLSADPDEAVRELEALAEQARTR